MVSFFPDFLSDTHKAKIEAKLQKSVGGKEAGLDTDERVNYSAAKENSKPEEKEESKEESKEELATKALSLLLHSLPEGSKFNIYSFGSTFKAIFSGGSETYSEETLEKSKA